jgi:hypothetical protein
MWPTARREARGGEGEGQCGARNAGFARTARTEEVARHVTRQLARVRLHALQDGGARVGHAEREVEGALRRDDAEAPARHAREVRDEARQQHVLAEAAQRQRLGSHGCRRRRR